MAKPCRGNRGVRATRSAQHADGPSPPSRPLRGEHNQAGNCAIVSSGWRTTNISVPPLIEKRPPVEPIRPFSCHPRTAPYTSQKTICTLHTVRRCTAVIFLLQIRVRWFYKIIIVYKYINL